MKKFMTLTGGFLLLVSVSAWAAAVNINTASADKLQTLEGIGEVKAQAIVAYRKKEDGFESKAELKKVDGIGPATFDSIKGDITTGGS